MEVISNRIIRELNPCYDPTEVVKDENEELSVKEWVAKYRDLVKDKSDIIWLLCNKLFMSDKDLRLFAVWCAREALKLVETPDPRSINACDIAEQYALGKASDEELAAAWAAATAASAASAADTARSAAARAAYWAAAAADAAADGAVFDAANGADWAAAAADARAAASDADWYAVWNAVWNSKIDKLLTYFK